MDKTARLSLGRTLATEGREPGVRRNAENRFTLVAMCLTVLMVQLDTTVANLALHEIQKQLHSDVAQLQWVIDGYNLVYATFILSGGALGDILGRKRIFLIGTAVFTVSMILCGLATSALALIACRAIAGLGATLALPGSLSILRVAYPDANARAKAVSIWAGINGVAIALGPSLGGILIHTSGWRSVFYSVAPVGLAAFVIASRHVRESADPEGRQLDFIGQAFAILCLGSLALGSIQGPVWNWVSVKTAAAFMIAALSFVFFLLREKRTKAPMVPLDVFREKAFSASLGVATAMTFGMYAMFFFMPLYLQGIRHQTPLRAGLELLPMGASFALISPFAGDIARRIGSKISITAGMIIGGLGIGSLGFVSEHSSMLMILAELTVVGIALGLETGPLMTIAVASLSSKRSGLASGLVNTGRMVGATLGVAILGAVLSTHVHEGGASAGAFLSGMKKAMCAGGSIEILGGLAAWLFIRDRTSEPTST